jgi:hypothetical protein
MRGDAPNKRFPKLPCHIFVHAQKPRHGTSAAQSVPAKAAPQQLRRTTGALQGAMKPNVIPYIAGLLFASAHAAAAPTISSIDVATLEANLNSQPLDKWLIQELGENWEIIPAEELSDCGEQSGTPGQSDFPLCLEIKLANGSELGYINICVGTYKAGVSGPPHFFFGVMNGKFFSRLSGLKSARAL